MLGAIPDFTRIAIAIANKCCLEHYNPEIAALNIDDQLDTRKELK